MSSGFGSIKVIGTKQPALDESPKPAFEIYPPQCCPDWVLGIPQWLREALFFYCRDCTQTSTYPSQGFIFPPGGPGRWPIPGVPLPSVTITEGTLGAIVDFSVPCIGVTMLLYRVTTGPFVIESVDAEGGTVAHDFNCPYLPNPEWDAYSCQNWSVAESVDTGGITRWAISAGAAQIVNVTCNGVLVYERYPSG